MAKTAKFSQGGDGRLYHRASGKAASPDLFVIGTTVYKPADNSVGRVKVGTVAKVTTKKQAAKVQRAEKRMQKRVRRTTGWLNMHNRPRTPPQAPGPDMTPQEAVQQAADLGLLSARDRAEVNYRKLVEKFKAEGKLTQEEAEELIRKYSETETDADRSELWDDLYEEFPPEKTRYH